MQDNYVQDKIRHMTRQGITCEINPQTGAARPMWLRELQDADKKRQENRRTQKTTDDIEWFAHG